MLIAWAGFASGALAASAVPADAAGSLRTADHIQVTAGRAGTTVLITLRIDPGYHVNANPPTYEALIPTTLAFPDVAPQQVLYPPAVLFKPAFADDPIKVYEGTVIITASFPAGALDRIRQLEYSVTAQACTERICLPPDDIGGRLSTSGPGP